MMMESAELTNYILACVGGLVGFLMNAIWQAVKELRDSDKEIVSKMTEIEVLVAGSYVKKDEFTITVSNLYSKLDNKIDK